MSFLVKNEEETFIVSFCNKSENDFVALATNSRQFYYEEIDGDQILDRINESENSIRLTLNKIVKKLREKPVNYQISLDHKSCLRLSIELEIKSSLRSLDTLKMYFILKPCLKVDDIGKYFFTGLLKSLIEQSMKVDGQGVSVKKFESSLDVNNLLNKDDIPEICKMIGVELIQEKLSDANDLIVTKENDREDDEKSERENERRAFKRVVEEKEFEYVNVDSQELNLLETNSQPKPSTSSKSKLNSKIPTKVKKKANVKF